MRQARQLPVQMCARAARPTRHQSLRCSPSLPARTRVAFTQHRSYQHSDSLYARWSHHGGQVEDVSLLHPPAGVFCQTRLQPPPMLELFDEPNIGLVEAPSKVWSRVDHLADADHLCGNIGYPATYRGSKDGHTKCGLSICRELDRSAQNVSAELAPILAARSTTGQHQCAIGASTEQVKRVKAQPLDVSHTLEQGSIQVDLVGRLPEDEFPPPRARGKGTAPRVRREDTQEHWQVLAVPLAR